MDMIGLDSVLRSATTEAWEYAPSQKQKILMDRVETQDVNVENPNIGKSTATHRLLNAL